MEIFSLNNVTVSLDKIMNNLLEDLKILIFKVIFYVENGLNFRKKTLINIGLIARKSALEKTQLSDVLITDNLYS